jgi:hypothetical protein
MVSNDLNPESGPLDKTIRSNAERLAKEQSVEIEFICKAGFMA